MAGALGFENTYALAMRGGPRARARRGARSATSRAPRRELEIGGDYEFFARAEWRALEATYGLAFRAQRTMDPSLMYRALAAGEVDVISAYSTDGRIAADDLVRARRRPRRDPALRRDRARERAASRASARRRSRRSRGLAGAIDARRDAPHERRRRRRRAARPPRSRASSSPRAPERAIRRTRSVSGKVRLRVTREGYRVAIRVRDEGIGMAPETLEKLFTKFYRADSTATRGIGGTGLGLALVKEIAEAHGGEVSADSEPGRGSEFTLLLPLVEKEEESEEGLDAPG